MNKKLKEISKKALQKISKSNFNHGDEWRYTSLSNFDKIKFTPQTINGKKKNLKFKNEVSFYNNELINNQTNLDNIFIDNIDTSLEHNIKTCTNYFNKILPLINNKFALYNTAYFKKGVFIHFKNNTHIKEPIYLNNIIEQVDEKSFLNCRYLFSFGKNVSIKIIIKDYNLDYSLLNTAIELFVNENSKIDFIFDCDNPNVTQIVNFAGSIKANAELNIYAIQIAGKLIKNNYLINLIAKNSSCNYNGINLLNDKNHIDNYIVINHLNKYTNSNTNQKNILSGKSKAVFYSKAKIDKNSSFSEANQKNNNIMLSSKANVYSNPQLEIYNNDVKCSHGSTTGEIDDESLFYLRSRGINLKDAKKILLNGFLNEALNPIENILHINTIKDNINKWLLNVN